jgi:hypothetical protein
MQGHDDDGSNHFRRSPPGEEGTGITSLKDLDGGRRTVEEGNAADGG